MAISENKSPETTPQPVAEPVLSGDQISVDEAFQRLRRHFQEPYVTCVRFNTALQAKTILLWVWDKDKNAHVVVDPNFIERHLRVRVQQAADSRWSADIGVTGGIGITPGPYWWRISASDVDTVVKNDAKSKPQHDGGRPPYDRDEILAAAFIELARFLQQGGILRDYSGNKWVADVTTNLGEGRSPGETVLKEVLNPIFKHLKHR